VSAAARIEAVKGCARFDQEVVMADVTVASFHQMERSTRASPGALGVTSFGRQVMTLPPDRDGYPLHRHDGGVEDANQEEVYIPLEGSAMLVAGDERLELRPGIMVRVGPDQLRQILPGREGVRFIALGGVPGTFGASPWTELGGPPPVPPS
jgi:mannose-6-phosphate isomerase-like protein (cupin superfamily)